MLDCPAPTLVLKNEEDDKNLSWWDDDDDIAIFEDNELNPCNSIAAISTSDYVPSLIYAYSMILFLYRKKRVQEKDPPSFCFVVSLLSSFNRYYTTKRIESD